MPKFSDPIPLDTHVVVETNRFGVVEHGFWDRQSNHWFTVCCTCGNIKPEAQVKGDTQCDHCNYLDEQPWY